MASIFLNWCQSIVVLDPCNHGLDERVEPVLACCVDTSMTCLE